MTITEVLLGYLALIIAFVAFWIATHSKTPAEEMAERDADWRAWQADLNQRAQKSQANNSSANCDLDHTQSQYRNG